MTTLLRTAPASAGGPRQVNWQWEPSNSAVGDFPHHDWQTDGFVDLDAFPGFTSRVFPRFWDIYFVQHSWRSFLTDLPLQREILGLFGFIAKNLGQGQLLYCPEVWDLEEICLRSLSLQEAAAWIAQLHGPPAQKLIDIAKLNSAGYFDVESFFVEELSQGRGW